MKFNRRQLLNLALELAVPAALITAYAVWAAPRNDIYFPPLQVILSAFVEDWLGAKVTADIWPSLRRLLLGFFIASILAIAIGLVLGTSRRARIATAPLVDFFRSLPPPALLPLTLLVLGVDDTAKVALIGLVCFFPVLLNTMAGVGGIDPLLRETARMYGIPLRDRILHVLIPGAMPSIFAGLRTSLSLAVIMMVISEFVAATNGVGYSIWRARRSFDIADMWAGIILLGILGILLNTILLLVEARLLAWHRGSRAAASRN
ncbi:ABC transporter permease [Pelagibacterium lacus]|uniref:ABC transporter permease n=1 Tax=Pelagibacterium lacus TaxID=2282655 RepID=A0A369W8B6_9HYPH|nr:ABC transporter permease [Pelagibacterium lacus]RDE10075.1 ABC transporter permease [Pelagibacterium lacus]